MDTDPPAVAACPQTGHIADNPAQDAVFYQCRSARTSLYKGVLVIVSQNDSFGKKATVQSPIIGSLEDHDKLSNTFHGSWLMRGLIL
jgi:hypothetical protein